MGILKPMGFDAYAYPTGTFEIANTDLGKVKQGMFCKLNVEAKIVLAGAGEKGFLTIFPNRLPKGGFAIQQGTFVNGPYIYNVDDECFDTTKTYVAGEQLFVNADGILTNDKAVKENPVPVAEVLIPTKVINDKKCLSIKSFNGCPVAK